MWGEASNASLVGISLDMLWSPCTLGTLGPASRIFFSDYVELIS